MSDGSDTPPGGVILNQRGAPLTGPVRKRPHVLEEFPDPRLECIVVQWERARPTVLVQLKCDPREPVQFPRKRPNVPGNLTLSKDLPSVLERPLVDFIDPATGRVFEGEATGADLVFSQRAFALVQPEPDLVLPVMDLWDCRTEALKALGVLDAIGFEVPLDLSKLER